MARYARPSRRAGSFARAPRTAPMDPVRLALDVGPLYGHRTGVGVAVAELAAALDRHAGVDVHPYVLSFRARPEPPVRKLPLPAAVAQRLWSVGDRPRLDRWLGGTDVVHGTNYVVPPSRRAGRRVGLRLLVPAQPRRGVVRRPAGRRGAPPPGPRRRRGPRLQPRHGRRRPRRPRRDRRRGRPPRPAGRAGGTGARPPGWLDGLAGRPFVLALGTIERRKNLPALVAAFAAAGLDPDTRARHRRRAR